MNNPNNSESISVLMPLTKYENSNWFYVAEAAFNSDNKSYQITNEHAEVIKTILQRK